MIILTALAALIALAALVALTTYLISRFGPTARRLRAAHHFIEQLRETAWAHRDLDPHLSTALIDEITRFHRTNRTGLNP